jgi:muconolactone delta-isomerase
MPAMPYYLVSFTLTQTYFDTPAQKQEALATEEIDHGKKLFKVGIWKHAYTTPGTVKTHSWAIYETSNEADLVRYLAEYPMAKLGMYTSVIDEVTIVDPPWIVGLLFKVLRSVGLYRPWTPA